MLDRDGTRKLAVAAITIAMDFAGIGVLTTLQSAIVNYDITETVIGMPAFRANRREHISNCFRSDAVAPF